MTSNALSPNHYQFPGGVQLRQISAHLTSFGGQAVQYVGRATRLDEQANKHPTIEGRIEDLNKAINFLRWEIERLETLIGSVRDIPQATGAQQTTLRVADIQVAAHPSAIATTNAVQPSPVPAMTGEKPVRDNVELHFTLASLMDLEEAAEFLGMSHEKFIAHAAETYARSIIASPEFHQRANIVSQAREAA
ncbi:hypothetical protein IU485_27725 [Nocardia cyriacigeorgica]|uniref:hypothetical protein n=1 Tax=Nocardia cyriacigeorgica TaxID=135487 RepID=UPI001893DBD3|nr:hypothetical protein [Nocardia cyriacigeorgica]MBF6085167.1 hypothetical protein [Nocardia cyriacigeorgica]